MRTILLFLSLTLVAGCQYVPPRGEDAPLISPPAGSTLELNRPLRIPSNDASVIIRDGRPEYSYWRLGGAYYPNCDFELRTRAMVERIIQPDVFTITRVAHEIENVMLVPSVVASHDTGNGAPHENYMTILYLHSDRQPDVFRMTCQHWEDPSDAQHLTIKQIRQALGDLFTLTLSEKAG
jgi:formylmethanofuran dehydrogenase subunit A